MSLNGISTLENKELRQIAKLNLAESDRERVGNPRSAYDINQLPTKYNVNSIVDNPNGGGLLQGRPWISLEAGLWHGRYSGWWSNGGWNSNYFKTQTPTSTDIVNNMVIASQPDATSEQYVGYFRPDYTGTWIFTLICDDGGVVWLGDHAISDYYVSPSAGSVADSNAFLFAYFGSNHTNTIDLVKDRFYPIRVMYGNNGGPGSLNISYSHPGLSTTTDFTERVFYNSITNGI